jgi:tripartite-type tricarboxylate transporter receptor subunit TctC
VAQSPFVLIVNPSLPIRSVADLIALAKERQGRLTFGSAGPGSPHHLFAELFKSMTGIQASHVAYRGSVPALNDVVGGHIDFMFCDFASAAPMLQGGKVRPIGVSIATRIPAFPDIPTISESGLSGFDVAAWFMVVAPARTPAPVVDRLHHELTQILAAPEIQQRIAQLSLVPMAPQPVAGMQDFVKSEIVRWGKVVHDAGIAGSE